MPTRMVLSAILTLLALFLRSPNLFAADASAVVQQQSVFQSKNTGKHFDAEESRLFKERARKEERAVVGQPFPASLKAYDAAGIEVRIRDLLQGPTVVIMLLDDSSLSDDILAYLREHGTEYARAHHVAVVVVAADLTGHNYADMLRGLPKGMVALHVTGPLLSDLHGDPVLGGGIAPVTLFLDANLVVTDRHLGTYGTPEETLTSVQ